MPSELYDASGVDRSWTDAVTNKVVLRGLDASAYLQWLNTRGTRVEPIIPQFLHELTHHWCFDSRVGRALALIRMRAGAAAGLGTAAKRDTAISVSIAKYEAAEVLLKPLAEGLALFAEFDTREGHMNVVSNTLMGLQTCFGFPLEGPKGHQISLLALLQGTRHKREFLDERKTPIYWRGFDCDDAYLPGYLAVKALHSRLKVDIPELDDPDLFLCYLRAYVFEDPALAQLLTAEQGEELAAATAVARRIHERMARFEDGASLREAVQTFDREVAAGNATVALSVGISASAGEVKAADTGWANALQAFVRELDRNNEHAKLIAGAILGNLELRRFLVVAREPVTVAQREGKLWLAAGNGEFLCSVPDDLTIPDGASAELLAVIGSPAHYVALTLLVGTKPHVVRWIGRQTEAERDALLKFATVRLLSDQIFELLDEAFVEFMERSWVSVIRDHVRKDSLEMATELYLSLSTLNVRDEHLAATRDRLLSSGLRGFLHDDPDLGHTLAVIGLANAFSFDVHTVTGFGSGLVGVEADAFSDSIDKLADVKTLPLVLRSGQHVFALV